MDSIGSVMILGGIAIGFLAQIAGAGVAFRSGIMHGLLSLTVPGYLLFTLNRSKVYWKIVGPWMVGVVGVVLGTILLS